MDNNRLIDLLRKYQDNKCTNEELEELETWYNSLNTDIQSPQQTGSDFFAGEMLEQFREKLAVQGVNPGYLKGEQIKPPVRKIFSWRRVAAAAVVISIIVAGGYILISNRNLKESLANNTNQVIQDVRPPDTNRAMITLADGRKVSLDSLTSITEGDVNITKNASGEIIYRGSATEVIYNTLFNPRGSKVISLTLSDGSKVWLNSESSLRYPVAFPGNQRKVEITGEAYFEVSKNPNKKFVVEANGAITEVLGTHFNVNAHEDEGEIKITLLEGKIKVSDYLLPTTDYRLLTPGQQARISNQIRLVNNVDVDEVMAWKNGNFQFEGADIKTVLKQMSRWYDVQIEYKGNITEHFGGTISRNVNVSQVFHMLQLTGELNYKIEGRKITVTP